MAEVLIAEIDVAGLTSRARMVLRAAVFHAFENHNVAGHEIPLELFCRLAGLSNISENEMTKLLINASKALGVLELINTAFPCNENVSFVSWQLLQSAEVIDGSVNFQLYQYTYKEVIRTVLMSVLDDSKLPSKKIGNQKSILITL